MSELRPMSEAPLDGTTIIIVTEEASVYMARSAYYSMYIERYLNEKGEQLNFCPVHDEEDEGWWYHTSSVGATLLDDWQVECALGWLPMPEEVREP